MVSEAVFPEEEAYIDYAIIVSLILLVIQRTFNNSKKEIMDTT